MRSRDRLQRIGLGVFPLIIITIVIAVIAGLFFKDYRQVPYGLFITIVWLGAAFFTFVFGIIFFAQFVLPPHKNDSAIEGVKMLLLAAGKSPKQTSTSPNKDKPIRSEVPGEEDLPESFKSLGAGILKNNQVLSIGRNSRLERAIGPGFVRLRGGERITQVIDLRTHIRGEEVVINTRDGIPLKTMVNVVFRIKQPSYSPPEEDVQYPYDEKDIFLVSQASSINDLDNLVVWTEQITPQAATYVVSEAAHNTIGELLNQFPSSGALQGVQRRVQENLKVDFGKSGIEIINVSITPLGIPPEVTLQWLDNWRVNWQRSNHAKKAKSESETRKQINHSRAYAQAQIIRKIIQNIEEMQENGDENLSQVVTLTMIEVLDKTMPNNLLRSTVTGQIITNMATEAASQMRLVVNQPEDNEPSIDTPIEDVPSDD